MILLRGVRIDSHASEGIGRFSELTDDVDLSSYNWSVSRVEMYHAHGGRLDAIVLPDIIEGSKFNEIMQQVNYVIFGRFIGYPTNSSEFPDVLSYNEFVENPAQIGILVVDADYYDFYCKDEQLTRKLGEKAESLNFNVEYIDESDSRLNWDI